MDPLTNGYFWGTHRHARGRYTQPYSLGGSRQSTYAKKLTLYAMSQHTHTHTHPFNDPFSGTTRVSWYQKGKTSLDFTEARDSEWQWHQLGHMQVCTSLQTDNHASTPPLSFLQAGCPSRRPTNSVKAPKAYRLTQAYRKLGWDQETVYQIGG